jgi:hypothetical protein
MARFVMRRRARDWSLDTTNYHRNNAGAIVMLKGNGVPPLEDGWVLLGQSYNEIVADRAKTALYNSIVKPQSDGSMTALDAGFRASDIPTFSPYTRHDVPYVCDFTDPTKPCGLFQIAKSGH